MVVATTRRRRMVGGSSASGGKGWIWLAYLFSSAILAFNMYLMATWDNTNAAQLTHASPSNINKNDQNAEHQTILVGGGVTKTDFVTHPAKLADGCYHIFLDVGANIGVHSRFLFEPDKYPEAKEAHNIFDSEFGDKSARDNRDICAFAFEPNPNHASRHQALEEAYKLQGWRYHYIPAAVSNAEGNITFYHNHDEENEEFGFSDHDLKTGGKAGSPVSVPILRLSDWLMNEVHNRKLPKDVEGLFGPRVVMKMDIESQEYAVLPDLMFSGSLCKTVNTIFGEYHPWAIKYDQDQSTGRGGLTIAQRQGPKKMRDFVAFFHSFRYCEMDTHFIELDDESYLHDGVPLPS